MRYQLGDTANAECMEELRRLGHRVELPVDGAPRRGEARPAIATVTATAAAIDAVTATATATVAASAAAIAATAADTAATFTATAAGGTYTALRGDEAVPLLHLARVCLERAHRSRERA